MAAVLQTEQAEQQKSIVPRLWSLESEIKGLAVATLPLKALGKDCSQPLS